MAKGPRYSVKFRRRRKGKTNYTKRKKLLAKGSPRLVIRKSNKLITTHITTYDKKGDKTSVFIRSDQLKKLGWKHSCKNLPAAYLTGLLIATKALKANITEAIADLGLYDMVKGSKLFSALKGAVDGGLKIPHDSKMFPSEECITGKHISDEIAKDFEEIKNKVMK
ncbi:50S ribosomal protein L18 [Candidatus Woesearchaeota archaeon]|nr:50S ribosomal protein L18 [Candidatus Woesearchaeota archaeon]